MTTCTTCEGRGYVVRTEAGQTIRGGAVSTTRRVKCPGCRTSLSARLDSISEEEWEDIGGMLSEAADGAQPGPSVDFDHDGDEPPDTESEP